MKTWDKADLFPLGPLFANDNAKTLDGWEYNAVGQQKNASAKFLSKVYVLLLEGTANHGTRTVV